MSTNGQFLLHRKYLKHEADDDYVYKYSFYFTENIWGMKLMTIMSKNTVSTTQKTQSVHNTNKNQLIIIRKMIVYFWKSFETYKQIVRSKDTGSECQGVWYM